MQQLTELRDEIIEQTVLACLILNPEEITGVHGIFPREAFWIEKHRKLYDAIRRVYRETGCADAYLVAMAAREDGFADAPNYLLGMLKDGYVADSPTFMSMYLPAYARRLRSVYADRERGKATLAYQHAVLRGEDEAEARIILDAVLDALDDLAPDLAADEDIIELLGAAGRYPTGMSTIDDFTGGLTKPGLNIIAARPSVGKSALLRGIVRNAAKDTTVFWYSLDQGKGQIYELELALLLRRDSRWARTANREDLLDGVRRLRSEVWRDRVILIDKPLKLPTLLSHARASGAGLVCVDYLQAVDSGVEGDREYDAVTKVSKALKALALEMHVPVVALSQLSRGVEGNEPPSLTHLRASGQIEQDADQVWGLQRDTSLNSPDAQAATLHVLKNKTGPTGKVGLTWVGKYAAYELRASESRAVGWMEK